MKYNRTQTGWLVIAIFGFILIRMITSYVLLMQEGKGPSDPLLFFIPFFGFCFLNFYQLTIAVDEKKIYVIYGIGLIRIKISPDRVNYVKSTETPWYAGFGIRFLYRGMLYNIQGRKAVEVGYQKGGKNKVVFLGTADQEALKRCIETTFTGPAVYE
ncbi:hypothetical protein GVN16_23225 [Emticicia sp. CRIBPO]|uniref:hypothetical protein n=1 Tax=Emticicia sp. CRIBPO TaxID=2683258 RepID=UPI0014121457|nr:hypothetical protein [Emticicia sp. CRIBPO]NBA88705.1 hypothetical protein [Emticicia sp. CRIBPO]